MKLLDEKGRLFGMINVIDLFVLMVIIYSAVFAVRWIIIAEDPSWTQVTILKAHCVAATEVPDYIADIVKVGDGITDVRGKVVGRIEKFESVGRYTPPAVYYSKNGARVVLHSRSNQRSLMVYIALLVYEKGGQLYSLIDNNPIRIGSSIFISTKNYSSNGVVRKILTQNETI
jgi:Domain of unknown function (DUF4330)